MNVRVRMAVTLALVLLGAVGCGSDDGASVRTIEEGGSGTGSGAASGAGSGSASGTGSGTGSEAAAGADPAQADTTVSAELGEWFVRPNPAQASAGVIAFQAMNIGAEEHEIVVARAESAEALPTKPDGTVDEEAMPAEDLLGEIEEFPAGTTMTGAFDMEPGTYVLFCNIYEEAEGESHFAEGMHTTFTVS